MLNKIKKLLKFIIGKPAEQKVILTITPNDERKKKNKRRKKKKNNTTAQAVSIEITAEQKQKKISVSKEKSGTKNIVHPSHPESLKEVEYCEGKIRFLDLALHTDVQFGIQYAGFDYCTPIQALTLPALLENRDLAGKAQTGTGKTAAFLLASFTRLLNNPLSQKNKGQPRMLVLAPTRELAIQIQHDAEVLGIFTNLNSAVVFGGMDHEKQRRKLDSQLDLLVGTPGRVIDFMRSGSVDLSTVEILVIDEADRMLDMGFIPDVKRIVSQLPPCGKRQTLLFSATLDESILRLSKGWLTDPVVIESEPEKMVSEHITQTFYAVARNEKLALLLYILRTMNYERMLIFGNRKDINLKLQSDLSRYGYNVPVLSGDISQEKRLTILEKFRSGIEKVIIATDVAARGIHVDNVSIVINFDLPERAEDYIHRIGRTGRAGHDGLSISFLCEYGAYYLPAIEELLSCQFSSNLPSAEMLELPPEITSSSNSSQSKNSRIHRNVKKGRLERRRH